MAQRRRTLLEKEDGLEGNRLGLSEGRMTPDRVSDAVAVPGPAAPSPSPAVRPRPERPTPPQRPNVEGVPQGGRGRQRTRNIAPSRTPKPIDSQPQEPVAGAVPMPIRPYEPDSSGSQTDVSGRPSPSTAPVVSTPPSSVATAADRVAVPTRPIEPTPTGGSSMGAGSIRPAPSISSASEPLTTPSPSPAADAPVRPSLGPTESNNMFGASSGGLTGGGIGLAGGDQAEDGDPTDILMQLAQAMRRKGTGT